MNDEIWTQEFLANPYLALARLRETAPVLWHPRLHAWLLTRYDDIATVLADHDRFSAGCADLCGTDAPEDLTHQVTALRDFARRWPPFLDPPHLTRQAAAVTDALHPRATSRTLNFLTVRHATELLDSFQDSGTFDAVEDFADPLTLHAFAHITGLTTPEAEQVRTGTRALLRALGAGIATPADIHDGHRAARELSGHLAPALNRHRTTADDTFLSRLAHHSAMNDKDLAAWTATLAMNLCEIGTGLIANALVTLLHHPQQLQALREDPTLMPAALQEILRFGALTIATPRRATCDTTLGGQPIRAGQYLYAIRCAANRDPHRFPDPDTFDIKRRHPAPQLTVHTGPHHPTTPLILQQAETALTALLSLDHLTVTAPHWPANLNLRYARPVHATFIPATVART